MWLVENRFRIKQNFEDLKKALLFLIVCMIWKKLLSYFCNFFVGELRVLKHHLNVVANKTVTISEWMSKYCQDIVAFNICHNIITWIKNLIETEIIYWKCYQEKTSPQWRINWIQLVILSNLPKVRKINSKGWGLWTLERFTSFFL